MRLSSQKSVKSVRAIPHQRGARIDVDIDVDFDLFLSEIKITASQLRQTNHQAQPERQLCQSASFFSHRKL